MPASDAADATAANTFLRQHQLPPAPSSSVQRTDYPGLLPRASTASVQCTDSDCHGFMLPRRDSRAADYARAAIVLRDLHGQAAHDSAPKAPDAFAQMGPQLPRTNGPAATTHARNAIHGIRTRDTCIFGHAASANSNTTNLLQAWDSALGQLLCPIFERNMVNARAVHSAFDGTRSNSLDFANAMILCLEPLSDSSAQPIHSRLRSSSPRHSSAPTLTTRFLRLLRLASHPPVQRKFPASFLLTPSVMPPLDHAAAHIPPLTYRPCRFHSSPQYIRRYCGQWAWSDALSSARIYFDAHNSTALHSSQHFSQAQPVSHSSQHFTAVQHSSHHSTAQYKRFPSDSGPSLSQYSRSVFRPSLPVSPISPTPPASSS